MLVASPVELADTNSNCAKLVLTYEPKLRHIVGPGAKYPTNPQLQALLDNEIGCHASATPPPPSMLLVLSYSIASELSSCVKRRGDTVCNAIDDGTLDAGCLNWEARRRQLIRQLLFYRADIMCLQGVQSASTSMHCSEAPEWEAGSADSDHLSHVYQGLAKANYSMAYAPTVQLSDGVSLGNAIFWNRSRWKLERHFDINSGSAICAQLLSYAGGHRVLACCAKADCSYSLDKGSEVSLEELAQPVSIVSERIREEVVKVDAIPIWCGDFGCELENLQSSLSKRLPNVWQSAFAEVLGGESWTSASEYSWGKAVDLVLHDERLSALAVLDGRPGQADVLQLLKEGFPSDHLLMLAAFEVRDPGVWAASQECLKV